MTTRNQKKRKTLTHADVPDIMEDTATSVRQQFIADREHMQRTVCSWANEILIEVVEPRKLLKSKRIEVECEIQNVKNSQPENESQMRELEQGLKTHKEIIERLKRTPNTVMGQHSEELQKSLEVTYTDMEKRREEAEMTKQDLERRLFISKMTLEKITEEELHIPNKDKFITKAYQLLSLALGKQRQKGDHSEVMDLKKQAELLSRNIDKETIEMRRQKEEDQSKIMNLKKQLELLSRIKKKETVEMKKWNEEDQSKIMDLEKQLELLSRTKDRKIREMKRQKEEDQSKIKDLKNRLELRERLLNCEIRKMRRQRVKDFNMVNHLRKRVRFNWNDPDKPKRPPSAFCIFMEEFRLKFKQKDPSNRPVADLGKAAGEKWKSMSAADKAPYEQTAEERRNDYLEKMKYYDGEYHRDAEEELEFNIRELDVHDDEYDLSQESDTDNEYSTDYDNYDDSDKYSDDYDDDEDDDDEEEYSF